MFNSPYPINKKPEPAVAVMAQLSGRPVSCNMAEDELEMVLLSKPRDKIIEQERQESLRLWRPCVMGIAWLSPGNVGLYMYSLEHDKTLIRVMRSTS
jgi:hypothetical protein